MGREGEGVREEEGGDGRGREGVGGRVGGRREGEREGGGEGGRGRGREGEGSEWEREGGKELKQSSVNSFCTIVVRHSVKEGSHQG